MVSHSLVFETSTNRLLDRLTRNRKPLTQLPPELTLARDLGVSRSTVRKAIDRLHELGIIEFQGRKKIVIRSPKTKDYFEVVDGALSKYEQAERFVLDRLGRYDLRPDKPFSELELARESGCNRGSIREALLRISHFGLIEKKPRQKWRVKKMDESLINELVEMRMIVEFHAAEVVAGLPKSHAIWGELQDLLDEHQKYLRTWKKDSNGRAFHAMDIRMHQALLRSCENRFIDNFFAVCLFIMNYQMRPQLLVEAHLVPAVHEHLNILKAVLDRNKRGSIAAMRNHLTNVRQALIEVSDR